MITVAADPSRVRVATHRDEDELLALVRQCHAETGLGDIALDKVRGLLRRAFTPRCNDPVLIGVAGQKSIEGSICLVVDTPPLSDTPFLSAVWNYVLPAFRKSSNAKDLIAFAAMQSQPAPIGIGLKLKMDIPATMRTEAQVRLYKRQLGDPVGYTWYCGSDAPDMRVN